MDTNHVIIIIIIIMSGTMINSVESKDNSGVYTTTSLKMCPEMIATTKTTKKLHGRPHRKYLYIQSNFICDTTLSKNRYINIKCICWDITWGQVCLARSAEKVWPVWEETLALQTVFTMPDGRLWNCKVYLELLELHIAGFQTGNAKTTFLLLFFVVINVLTYMKKT